MYTLFDAEAAYARSVVKERSPYHDFTAASLTSGHGDLANAAFVTVTSSATNVSSLVDLNDLERTFVTK